MTLDLDPRKPPWTSSGAKAILDVLKAAFNYEVDRGPIDLEYAERDSLIHVARFSNDTVENDAISNTVSSVPEMLLYHQPRRELKMVVEQPGLLDSLVSRDDPSASDPLPEDFVEIESKAFGVNFRDIMVGMGQMQEKIMGFACSGIVTKIGANVLNSFKSGDRVCATISTGGWSSFQRLHWTGLAHIPDDTTFEAAASIPMVFVTAYYCFYESARLREGESVLIHAGSGGVGQSLQSISEQRFSSQCPRQKRRNSLLTLTTLILTIFSPAEIHLLPQTSCLPLVGEVSTSFGTHCQESYSKRVGIVLPTLDVLSRLASATFRPTSAFRWRVLAGRSHSLPLI